MATKQFKERAKRLTIPKYFWDNEKFVEASEYSGWTCYTDAVLAETLGFSPMRISMLRNEGKIPFTMGGSFAIYDLNKVIEALLKQGYKQEGKNESK